MNRGRPSPTGAARFVALVPSLLLGAAALIGLTLAVLPIESMRSLAGGIRQPADVTSERVLRFRQVVGALALCAAAGCIFAVWLRRDVSAAGRSLWNQMAALLADRPAVRPALAVAALLVLPAGVLRCCYLWAPFAYDEAYSYVNFASRTWYLAISDYNSPNNHLLNTLLMCVCDRLWGQAEWALRLPVLVAGLALVVCVYRWSASWANRRTALLTASLVGCSPLLITYSVDARGYSFVALFAVLLDHSLARIETNSQRPAIDWFLAWASLVLGFYSIPVMIYPAVGIVGWFALAPLLGSAPLRRARCRKRIVELTLLGGATGVTVLLLYAPAYVFRGSLVLRNPQFGRLSVSQWVDRASVNLSTGWQDWTAGPLPWWIWLAVAIPGFLWMARDRGRLLRFGFPIVSLLAVMACQGVVPPPRVFLFLAPWWYLLVALGVDWFCRRSARPERVAVACVVGLTVLIGVYASRRPVLFLRLDRELYLSVPSGVREVRRRTDSTPGADRLLVPVPCDLPSRFYILKEGFTVPINGVPKPGETVWLFALRGSAPEVTLRNSTVRLEDWQTRLAPWVKIQQWNSLTLWRSARSPSRRAASR
ncbi:MAG: hypothetical protein CMJ59_15115 [Planctomycetaceae bacterium]|nr:hypothetical protein [Planctomycetaceae bacterium]